MLTKKFFFFAGINASCVFFRSPKGEMFFMGYIGVKPIEKKPFHCEAISKPNLRRVQISLSISRRITNVAIGNEHALFLTSDNLSYGLGDNEYGQLSITDEKEINQAKLIDFLKHFKIIGVYTASFHSVFLSEDGIPYSCGENYDGQCGNGSGKSGSCVKIATRMKISERICDVGCGERFVLLLSFKKELFKSGIVHANDRRSLTPEKIVLGEKVKRFYAGGWHFLIQGISNKIYGFGRNAEWQLTNEISKDGCEVPTLIKKLKNVVDVRCGYNSSYVVTNDGDLLGFGANYCSETRGDGISIEVQSTPFLMKKNIVEIECQSHGVLCVDKNSELYVVGENGSSVLIINPKNGTTTKEVDSGIFECTGEFDTAVFNTKDDELLLSCDGGFQTFKDEKFGPFEGGATEKMFFIDATNCVYYCEEKPLRCKKTCL